MKNARRILIFCLMAMFMLASVTYAWPGYMEGKPHSFDPGDSLGYFIWHDDEGFHLRTTTFYLQRKFTGVIRTDGKFRHVDEERLEGQDKMMISDNKRMIRFNFATQEGTDGFDFHVQNADWLQFDLYIDGHQVNTQRIYLGKHSIHPRDNNFRIHDEHRDKDRNRDDDRHHNRH